MSSIFSKNYNEILKKAQINPEKFSRKTITYSFVFSFLIALLIGALLFFKNKSVLPALIMFVIFYFVIYNLLKMIPNFSVKSKKSLLESDLLYSARHLLLKLESGSSLINCIESVSFLDTNSSMYFKELMLDISLGIPLEEAIEKAIEYSPSKAYTKLLEEIKTSLKTGADLQNTLKSTLKDITRNHLIHIQEYGKKLNPMSMFYMILGAIVPSIGTAILIVSSSLLPGVLVIDLRLLLFIVFVLLMVQIFFVLTFRSLKPAVME